MRKLIISCLVSTGLLAALGGVAIAQSGPPPPPPPSGMSQYHQIDLIGSTRPNARLVPRESGNPLQVKAAAKLVAELNLPCEVSDAAPLSARPSKAQEYEIACKDALGWIVSYGPDGKATPHDCMALDTGALAAGKAWPKGMVCSLDANAAPVAGLRPLAAKVDAGCVLTDGTFLGGGGNPPILRYEVACKNGKGYIVDSPAPGSTASLSSMSCLEAKDAGVACTLAAGKDKRGG